MVAASKGIKAHSYYSPIMIHYSGETVTRRSYISSVCPHLDISYVAVNLDGSVKPILGVFRGNKLAFDTCTCRYLHSYTGASTPLSKRLKMLDNMRLWQAVVDDRVEVRRSRCRF
jgi:hypothetical protein